MANDEPPIGKYETIDINNHVDRLLRDLGRPEPPLRLEYVRELQKLDLTYYQKSDLNLLDEMAHRAKMAGSTMMSTAKQMVEVVDQFGLRGLLMLKENEKKIFIDDDVVPLKRRFLIAHEITHDLLPWHRALLLGDNEETLSPACHQVMEAEANYGGRRLIFMGGQFQAEARDSVLSWDSIKTFKTRYGNTLTTTLWQMVCEREPNHPVFGVISRHPTYPEIGDRGNGKNVGYFIQSDGFRAQFANVDQATVYDAICSYVGRRKTGPIGEDICVFSNVNGEPCDFEMFSFCNSYDLLTFGVYKGLRQTVVGF